MNDSKNIVARHFGLRSIAILEATKGALSILAACLLLALRHRDFQAMAAHILEFLHISPGRKFFQAVMRAAGHVTIKNLWIVFFGVMIYAIVRFVEATGLWLEKEWAEWFALLSGAMYMPWEIYEIIRHSDDKIRWTIFIFNILIVLYLLWLLNMTYGHRRRAKLQQSAEATDSK